MLIENSENFYEVAWAVREAIFKQIIEGGGRSLHAALDAFCEFECTHNFMLETRNARILELNQDIAFLTGNVRIEPISGAGTHEERRVELADALKRVDRLADLADGDFDAIVELGCGYGLNLFRLHRALGGRPMRYIAAEYTNSGRRLCAELAKLDGGMPLETAFIDHKDPDLGFMAGIDRALIFTCHSIEQVASLPETYFSVLAGAAPSVLCAHFEPFGFQVECETPRTRNQKDFFRQKGWNADFYTRLKAAEAAGTLNLRTVELECFAAQSDNPTSVAIWDSGAG